MTDTVTNERLREIAVSKSLYGSGITYLEFIGIASELLARRTAPAEPVAIKPLEWRQCATDEVGTLRLPYSKNAVALYFSDTTLGTYGIVKADDRYEAWLRTKPVSGSYASSDEAKAAAQADYERRILSAIKSLPNKDGMLEEAALGAAEAAWRSSVHPTCRGMLTEAIKAYFAALKTQDQGAGGWQ